jgi:hypothetical protein
VQRFSGTSGPAAEGVDDVDADAVEAACATAGVSVREHAAPAPISRTATIDERSVRCISDLGSGWLAARSSGGPEPQFCTGFGRRR